MMKQIAKYGHILFPLLFGVLVFVFWRGLYPFALTYHEQFQLFLLDTDYFTSRLSQPGGLARYAGEFLVQFYNMVTAGALLLALLYVLIQQAVWRLAVKNSKGARPQWYAMTFVPSAILWLAMGDENVMISFIVAFTLQLAILTAYPRRDIPRLVYALVMIPVCYWLLGPVVLMAVVYMAMVEFRSRPSRWTAFATSALMAVYALGTVLLSSVWLPFPLVQLFYGIDYYRIPGVFFRLLLLPGLLAVMLPFVMCSMPQRHSRSAHCLYAACIVAVAALLCGLKPVAYDARKYDLIEYDYLVRLQRWDDIIRKSEQHMPDLPLSVSVTNLALGMTQQLGDRAFHFYQNGGEGLLPRFERNHFSALSASEVYYQLGMTNTAQRFAFEAQEAIPNYNKSARIMKRLAETNLINGQYDVAVKYLRLLQKTMFYRKWADRMMALAGNRKAIDQHPVYGYMHRCHLKEDFLYSETEADKILGLLFMQNKENTLAMQYLAVYPLMERDLQKFMLYLPIIENYKQYNPQAIQEGVALACMQQHQQPPQGFLNPMTEQRFRDFAQAYANSGKSKEQLGAFKNTFWFYMMAKDEAK